MWDLYASLRGRAAGTEWGDAGVWEWRFGELFRPARVEEWRLALEIGAGAGKYTRKVLEASGATVHCADISRAFLRALETELEPFTASGRLRTVYLRGDRAAELLVACEQRGLRGALDAVYSVDAMVHVDLQHLIAYLVTAALCLRRGGALVLTLADPTTPRGFRKLLADMQPTYAAPGTFARFEWVSADLVRALLARLGYRLIRCDAPARPGREARDLFVVAVLDDAAAAIPLEGYLRAD
jgi:cyclopropane fatty-acyl-phospholipid synthase-like methyltransferase